MKKIILFNIVILYSYLSAQVFEGLTLYSSFANSLKNTFLIDTNENVINSWSHTNAPASHPYLLKDTSIIYPYKVAEPYLDGNAGGVGGGIQKISKNGIIEWNYIFSDSIYQHHHDISVLPNDNILLIVWEIKSAEEAMLVGRENIETELNEIWSPAVIEFNPVNGAIVWEWHIWDHLVQDVDSSLSNYGIVSHNKQRMNINYGTIGSIDGANGDWMHINSIDYNPSLDQIVLSSRNTNELYVIDHSTTIEEAASNSGGEYGRGGDFLFRWGNPEVYNMGNEEDRQLFGQHDVTWVGNSELGSNHFLLFNNGFGRPDGNYSTIDFIIPSKDFLGNYLLSDDSTFFPETVHTLYSDDGFYSGRQSSAQYLENGNILLSSSAEKRIFEINNNGTILWEYNLEGTYFINRASKYSAGFLTGLSSNIAKNKIIQKPFLSFNKPNPFNPITLISYDLPFSQKVNLTIYDLRGNVIITLIDKKQERGIKNVQWNAKNQEGQRVPTGIYFYKISTNNFESSKKMILLK